VFPVITDRGGFQKVNISQRPPNRGFCVFTTVIVSAIILYECPDAAGVRTHIRYLLLESSRRQPRSDASKIKTASAVFIFLFLKPIKYIFKKVLIFKNYKKNFY